ncbi:DUF58 domain-containing protein [Meiothermus hypogaeus]|uniref:DUF58 domain-containing protein n=2 Tax=Meiothermus hypogaeus TaxID=884155 RepID=A0A511R2S3_9DEIN|nr:DUF58 domain-containing protein [Meiothermus hypogaeus]RIH76093.1 hypothetical protein Mhypo_02640 [Meiothermus hypogaeus]GEM83879.1 hypothetical protein MHY01S_20450 [Meiothermus hypogaeus NBRC 106114]GIW36445.1 MAG: hypothetical protein KatS3mg073_0590 [Meiothermus sp.]
MNGALVPTPLLQQLIRKKLVVRRALASLGIGERRSKAKGPGIEFAEHRPYQIGDDIRYLDPYLEARLGQPFIKQFTMYQQLSVTVLLDASLSMAQGAPEKFTFAQKIAAGLAYTGIAGGDQVLLGAFSGECIRWSPMFRGIYKASELFAWLQHLKPGDTTLLPKVVAKAAPRLRRGGLLFLVSDWMGEGAEEAVALLQGLRQDIVGIHVLAPDEVEPERVGSGGLRLADVENGEEIELVLDAGLLQRYMEHLENWKESLKALLQRQQGLYFQVRSDDNLELLFLRDFQAGGLLR